ncbi:hypothetical protein ABEB36_005842 [Hypothenemus hampei]|uniref:WW domain-containing protein n=1 Tax=Hypothenemus hampei TaxID=57062 RepID=A0ABD1EZL2_HYPHA
MEATVEDFLNEINKLPPKKEADLQLKVWQECLDELTGYSYFWNTETDEVTWVPPKNYKPAEKDSTNKKNGPKCSPKGSTSQSAVKIYSIQENSRVEETKTVSNSENYITKKEPSEELEEPNKKTKDKCASYETRILHKTLTPANSPKNNLILQESLSENEDDDNEDINLLQAIKKRSQEIIKVDTEKKHMSETNMQTSKAISGFSLVAGYESASDSEPESENNITPVTQPEPQKSSVEIAHSTLFPITEPIDVNNFCNPERMEEDIKEVTQRPILQDNFDNKAFKRKRRIGISLVNNIKKPNDCLPQAEEEIKFTGLGFKSEKRETPELNPEKEDKPNAYPGFQKGGVMFLKQDILEHAAPTEIKRLDDTNAKQEDINKKSTEDDYEVLREKLLFLGEGREPIFPVQVMLIQAETLYSAMKEGGLRLSYLRKWLNDMCSELVKLEKESAPEGWLLQWDRSHKRYFYQNQTTGTSQWQYPEADVTRCDDAMDISTTPPPPEIESDNCIMEFSNTTDFGPQLPIQSPGTPLPPSPPKIKSPTPPPAPVISGSLTEVATAEPPVSSPPLKKNDVVSDNLSTALDSFYSEIAEVTENTTPPITPLIAQHTSQTLADDGLPNTDFVKKKKKKVKLAQGLTMKKKGVSQMVEKWKNVHKIYGE